MTAARRRAVALSLLAVMGGVVLLCYSLRIAAFREDYSQRPPDQVFRMALGIAPPGGISGLRAAGRHYFVKRWVWLRFDASDDGVRRLLAALGAQPADTQLRSDQSWSANGLYDTADKHAVQWDDIRLAASPAVYEYHQVRPDAWMWSGVILVDHRRHRVFVHAGGD